MLLTQFYLLRKFSKKKNFRISPIFDFDILGLLINTLCPSRNNKIKNDCTQLLVILYIASVPYPARSSYSKFLTKDSKISTMSSYASETSDRHTRQANHGNLAAIPPQINDTSSISERISPISQQGAVEPQTHRTLSHSELKEKAKVNPLFHFFAGG